MNFVVRVDGVSYKKGGERIIRCYLRSDGKMSRHARDAHRFDSEAEAWDAINASADAAGSRPTVEPL